MRCFPIVHFIFFFHDPAPTEIYTLSLHDALPISTRQVPRPAEHVCVLDEASCQHRVCSDRRSLLVMSDGHCRPCVGDRKSTRLNSSHMSISYAVFCLKKKKKKKLYAHRLNSNRSY